LLIPCFFDSLFTLSRPSSGDRFSLPPCSLSPVTATGPLLVPTAGVFHRNPFLPPSRWHGSVLSSSGRPLLGGPLCCPLRALFHVFPRLTRIWPSLGPHYVAPAFFPGSLVFCLSRCLLFALPPRRLPLLTFGSPSVIVCPLRCLPLPPHPPTHACTCGPLASSPDFMGVPLPCAPGCLASRLALLFAVRCLSSLPGGLGFACGLLLFFVPHFLRHVALRPLAPPRSLPLGSSPALLPSHACLAPFVLLFSALPLPLVVTPLPRASRRHTICSWGLTVLSSSSLWSGSLFSSGCLFPCNPFYLLPLCGYRSARVRPPLCSTWFPCARPLPPSSPGFLRLPSLASVPPGPFFFLPRPASHSSPRPSLARWARVSALPRLPLWSLLLVAPGGSRSLAPSPRLASPAPLPFFCFSWPSGVVSASALAGSSTVYHFLIHLARGGSPRPPFRVPPPLALSPRYGLSGPPPGPRSTSTRPLAGFPASFFFRSAPPAPLAIVTVLASPSWPSGSPLSLCPVVLLSLSVLFSWLLRNLFAARSPAVRSTFSPGRQFCTLPRPLSLALARCPGGPLFPGSNRRLPLQLFFPTSLVSPGPPPPFHLVSRVGLPAITPRPRSVHRYAPFLRPPGFPSAPPFSRLTSPLRLAYLREGFATAFL